MYCWSLIIKGITKSTVCKKIVLLPLFYQLYCIIFLTYVNASETGKTFYERQSLAVKERYLNAEHRLIHYLMTGYDKRVRPVLFANDTVNVTFGNSLSQLIDVDEKNQIITTNSWLNMNWLDVNLMWNPADFDNVTVIHLPYKSIWLPDIILYNNAESAYQLATLSTNVIVQWDGNVTWLSTNIFESACLINVKWFPFDEQFCDLIFASWTYSNKQLEIGLVTDEMDISNYMRNTEWDLMSVLGKRNNKNYSCCPDVTFPDVTFTINIRRKPLFYVFNMLLPCIIITYVALLGFLVPAESGEKVTMGITTLLSMTVFLMLVCEQLPPNSKSLPMIGVYYGVSISIVSLATGFTVLTLNVHNMGATGKLVPAWLRMLCFAYLARILCLKINLFQPPPAEVQYNDHFEDGHMTMSSSNLPPPPPPPPLPLPLPPLDKVKKYATRLRSLSTQFPHQKSTDAANVSPKLKSTKRNATDGNASSVRYRQEEREHEELDKFLNEKDKCTNSQATTFTFNQTGRIIETASLINKDFSDRHIIRHIQQNEVFGLSPVSNQSGLINRKAAVLIQNTNNSSRLNHPNRSNLAYEHLCSSISNGPVCEENIRSPTLVRSSALEYELHQVLQQIDHIIKLSESRWEDQQAKLFVSREWHEVAKVLDRLFLLLFVCLTTGVTVGLIIQAPTASYSMTRSNSEHF